MLRLVSESILIQVGKKAAFVTSLLNRVTLQAYPSLNGVTNGYHASLSTTTARMRMYVYLAHPCLNTSVETPACLFN